MKLKLAKLDREKKELEAANEKLVQKVSYADQTTSVALVSFHVSQLEIHLDIR